jgi:hypothetical protein
MHLQQFGEHYPHFGGHYLETLFWWMPEEAEDCLRELNSLYGEPQIIPRPTKETFRMWGAEYLVYRGMWVEIIAFPRNPSNNLYLLKTPRHRKDVDIIHNHIVKWWEKLKK